MGQLTNRAAKKEETDRTIQSSALSVSQVPYKLSSSIEGEASSKPLFSFFDARKDSFLPIYHLMKSRILKDSYLALPDSIH